MRVYRGFDSLPSMISNLNTLRRNKFRCDHLIVCDGVDARQKDAQLEIPLHSLILQSSSSIFRGKDHSEEDESQELVTHVSASHSIVLRLVQLLYGEVVELLVGEEEVFWKAALELGLEHLVNVFGQEDDDHDDGKERERETLDRGPDERVPRSTVSPPAVAATPSRESVSDFCARGDVPSEERGHDPDDCPQAQMKPLGALVKTEIVGETSESASSGVSAEQRAVANHASANVENADPSGSLSSQLTYGDVLGLEEYVARSGSSADWEEGLTILGVRLPSELVFESLSKFKERFAHLCEGRSEEELGDVYQRMAGAPFPNSISDVSSESQPTPGNASDAVCGFSSSVSNDVDSPFLFGDFCKSADATTSPPGEVAADLVKIEPHSLPPPPPPGELMYRCFVCGFKTKKKPVVIAHIRSLHKKILASSGEKVAGFFGLVDDSDPMFAKNPATDPIGIQPSLDQSAHPSPPKLTTMHHSIPPPSSDIPFRPPSSNAKPPRPVPFEGTSGDNGDGPTLPLQIPSSPPPKKSRRFCKSTTMSAAAVAAAARKEALLGAALRRRRAARARQDSAFPKGPRYNKTSGNGDDPDWTPTGLRLHRGENYGLSGVTINPSLVARGPVAAVSVKRRDLFCDVCSFTTKDPALFAAHSHRGDHPEDPMMRLGGLAVATAASDSDDAVRDARKENLGNDVAAACSDAGVIKRATPEPNRLNPAPSSSEAGGPSSSSSSSASDAPRTAFTCPFPNCSYTTHKDAYLDKHLWFRHKKTAKVKDADRIVNDGDMNLHNLPKNGISNRPSLPPTNDLSNSFSTNHQLAINNQPSNGRSFRSFTVNGAESPADFIRSLNSLVCGSSASVAARIGSQSTKSRAVSTPPSSSSTVTLTTKTAPLSRAQSMAIAPEGTSPNADFSVGNELPPGPQSPERLIKTEPNEGDDDNFSVVKKSLTDAFF